MIAPGATVSLNLFSTLHSGVNDFAIVGMLILVMMSKGIGHKRLVAAIAAFFASHGLTALAAGHDLYLREWTVTTGTVREASAVIGSIAVCLIGVGIADIIRTLRISEVETQQVKRFNEFLDREQQAKVLRIDDASKRQNVSLTSLLRKG